MAGFALNLLKKGLYEKPSATPIIFAGLMACLTEFLVDKKRQEHEKILKDSKVAERNASIETDCSPERSIIDILIVCSNFTAIKKKQQ